MFRTISSLAVGLVTAGLLAASAAAAPLSPLKAADTPTVDGMVTLVHGCHRDVHPDINGRRPHYHAFDRRSNDPCREIHVNRGGPRYVEPRPRYYEPAPRYYDPPRRRQPACFQECNYIGPIRQCRTVCR